MDASLILKQSSKKPQSILKIVLSLAVIMLVLWMFLVSRMEVSEKSKTILQTTEQPENVKNALLQKEVASPQVQEEESVNMFRKALPAFLTMMVILGGIWLWSVKKSKVSATASQINEIESYVLGQGSQLKVVEINNEVWVLGMHQNSLNLLHRVPKSEWEFQEMPQKEEHQDFKAMYNFFKK